ncbi:hypothetical protein HII31_10550 [Pseudocercospora fuligena]|uniref:Uncharacterized protein n=1 Tax=Pseudocercospora fuligena TaxID=685502 RepID=A0A8H6VDB7_9PEZI|nr:hypothetical protein HII31_10550 [Pseudocercospora fuligena]
MIKSRVDRGCRQSTIVATTFCVLSIIWLLYYLAIRYCSMNPFHHEKFSVAEELSRLVPSFPTHPVVFWNDSTYGDLRNVEDMSTDELDVLYQKWDDLIPRGLGLVSLDVGDGQDHLPPAIPYRSGTGPEKPYYFISVFHQLHCLASTQLFPQLRLDLNDTRVIGIDYARIGAIQ